MPVWSLFLTWSCFLDTNKLVLKSLSTRERRMSIFFTEDKKEEGKQILVCGNNLCFVIILVCEEAHRDFPLIRVLDYCKLMYHRDFYEGVNTACSTQLKSVVSIIGVVPTHPPTQKKEPSL